MAVAQTPAQRAVIYFPPTPADPYLTVVFNSAGELVSATPAPNWRMAEAALAALGYLLGCVRQSRDNHQRYQAVAPGDW